MVNGEASYRDSAYTGGTGNPAVALDPLSGGLGELVDTVVGNTDWAAPNTPWVGWTTVQPTLTFDFGPSDNEFEFTKASLHMNNFVSGGVSIWDSVDVSYSSNGVSFGAATTYMTSPADQADTTARFIDLVLDGTGRYVRFNNFDDGAGSWIFLSEVTFEGQEIPPVPEPSSLVLLGLGALSLVRHTRRRRRKA
jgi:hypothetical protein